MYFSHSISPPATSYATRPMDIPSTSSSGSRPQSPNCAFPSWPRRASLDSNEDRATSYISNDDLEDLFSNAVFEEQDYTPLATPSRTPEQVHVVVDTGAMMREIIAQEKARKERKQRRKSGGKKSRSGSGTSQKMSPIAEVGE